jgi:hypothetical protein
MNWSRPKRLVFNQMICTVQNDFGISVTHAHLGPIWYHSDKSKPSAVPFLQQDGSSTSLHELMPWGLNREID